MIATDVLRSFVGKVLVPERAARFVALAETDKGQLRLLGDLDHKFEPGIQLAARSQRHEETFWNQPCFAFHRTIGFGAQFATAHEAYTRLSDTDSWLIVSADGRRGVYRPEARWDDEAYLVG